MLGLEGRGDFAVREKGFSRGEDEGLGTGRRRVKRWRKKHGQEDEGKG